MMNKWIKYLLRTIAGVIALFCLTLGGYVMISERPFPIGSVVLNVGDGLGNQMFRYAAAYSLAKKTHSKLYIISGKVEEEKGNVDVADRNPALNRFNIFKDKYLYRRKLRKVTFIDEYVTESNFFELSNKWNFRLLIMTNENFADEKFFKDYKSNILEFFTPNFDYSHLQTLITQVSQPNSVCIHIRGGDMLQDKTVINIDYQKRAMKLMDAALTHPKYFIFSDSMDLVKKELPEAENISFLHKLPLEDFVLMSKCGNNIIAGSTFSWWAAYLNHNKNHIVIAPSSGIYGQVNYPKEWLLAN